MALPCAVFSGILTALCLPKPGLCFLGWVSLIPLMRACRGASFKRASLLGLAAGFAFHGLALYWIYEMARFARISVPISFLAWAGLSALLGINWGFIAASFCWIDGRGLARGLRPWLWPLLWTAWEALWLKTPRLCLDLPAYTQYKNLALIQINSVLGPHGLGFLVVASNAALAEFLDWAESDFPVRRATLTSGILAAFLVLGAWVYGRRSLEGSASVPQAGVEILQPDIDQYQKWDSSTAQDIDGVFKDLLSRPRAKSPELIVWPEAALPRFIEEGAAILEASPWSVKLGADQIVGAAIQKSGKSYNGAEFIGPDGLVKTVYLKRELVPFGEYVPWNFLRGFSGYLDQLGDFSPGPETQALFKSPLGTIGCTICYEAAFPSLSQAEAARGARILANLTNDDWYKDTWGPYQHFGANIFRAVENRVYVLRAANSGISAVIDPWGRVSRSLPLGIRGRLDAGISLQDPFPRRSFYARHGDWFGLSCVVLAGIWFCASLMLV